MICPRCRAAREQKPRSLNILDLEQFTQQDTLFRQSRLSVRCHEFWRAKRRAQDYQTSQTRFEICPPHALRLVSLLIKVLQS